jgi:hypothetical protein
LQRSGNTACGRTSSAHLENSDVFRPVSGCKQSSEGGCRLAPTKGQAVIAPVRPIRALPSLEFPSHVGEPQKVIKVISGIYLGVSVHWTQMEPEPYLRHLNQSTEFVGRRGSENPGGNDAWPDANSIDTASPDS